MKSNVAEQNQKVKGEILNALQNIKKYSDSDDWSEFFARLMRWVNDGAAYTETKNALNDKWLVAIEFNISLFREDDKKALEVLFGTITPEEWKQTVWQSLSIIEFDELPSEDLFEAKHVMQRLHIFYVLIESFQNRPGDLISNTSQIQNGMQPNAEILKAFQDIKEYSDREDWSTFITSLTIWINNGEANTEIKNALNDKWIIAVEFIIALFKPAEKKALDILFGTITPEEWKQAVWQTLSVIEYDELSSHDLFELNFVMKRLHLFYKMVDSFQNQTK